MHFVEGREVVHHAGVCPVHVVVVQIHDFVLPAVVDNDFRHVVGVHTFATNDLPHTGGVRNPILRTRGGTPDKRGQGGGERGGQG